MSRERRRIPPLTPEQQKLVTSVERLIHQRVRKIVPWATADERKDYVAAGREGAGEPAAFFEPARGYRFTTYAMPFIDSAIRRLRDQEREYGAAKDAARHAGCTVLATEPEAVDAVRDEPEVNRAKAHDMTRRLFTAMAAGVAMGPLDPHEAYEVAELRAKVQEAIAKLDEENQAALRLVKLEALAHEEAGEALGVSERTVRRRLEAALEELAVILRAMLGPEPER
jgi:RNA polymerase sigma factor (sigma-70 family)